MIALAWTHCGVVDVVDIIPGQLVNDDAGPIQSSVVDILLVGVQAGDIRLEGVVYTNRVAVDLSASITVVLCM